MLQKFMSILGCAVMTLSMGIASPLFAEEKASATDRQFQPPPVAPLREFAVAEARQAVAVDARATLQEGSHD